MRLADSFEFVGKLAVYAGGREEQIAGEEYKMTSNVAAMRDIIARYPGQVSGSEIRIIEDRAHNNILGPAASLGLEYLFS